jgi:hypothetical protein
MLGGGGGGGGGGEMFQIKVINLNKVCTVFDCSKTGITG